MLVIPLALVVPTLAGAGLLGVDSRLSEGHAVGSPGSTTSGMAVAVEEQRLADTYAKLPLSFIPNAGQADPRVLYAAQGPGFAVSFTRTETLLSFVKGKRGQALALRFLGANPVTSLTARSPLRGTVNYLVGAPADWRTGLHTYEEVIYQDLWPGIDVVFRGGEGELKYEFHVAPGARVRDIRLGYRGADALGLGGRGELLIRTQLGTLRDAHPVSYQSIGAKRVAVESSYLVAPDGTYGFALGPGYDPRLPLIIDPALVYSTFLGGSQYDAGFGIAVDPAGHAYVTGFTGSPDFPTTPGAFDPTNNGGDDALVTKLRPDGSALVYSTFLGGGGEDWGYTIEVDATGHAYVTGHTRSPDFPTTPGAFDTTFNGDPYDAFVTRLSPDGSALVYSTFLGGKYADIGAGIEVDAAGQVFVSGLTHSPDFPTTPGAFDRTFNGVSDAFVAGLSPDGSALVYSTFLGGRFSDWGIGIEVDAAGHAYLSGVTFSPDFPTTPGAFDRTYDGDFDAFVARLSPGGSAHIYSTFLGGASFDHTFAGGLGLDLAGHAYVTGVASSPDFPTTPGAFDPTYNGGDDAFVTKLSPDGSALVYSTFLGETSWEGGVGIAVTSAGDAYISGYTDSPDFPTTPGAFDPTYNGLQDVFVTTLNRYGTALVYSIFLGGASSDTGGGIGIRTTVASSSHVYVTGYTGSRDFPTTPGAFDTTFNGDPYDAFVSTFVIGDKATR